MKMPEFCFRCGIDKKETQKGYCAVWGSCFKRHLYKSSHKADEVFRFEFKKGRLKSLKKICSDFGLKDLNTAIDFLLAVGDKANGSDIIVDGNRLRPADGLLKSNQKENE